MKNVWFTLLLLLPALAFFQDEAKQKKVLMVLSSYGKDEGATRPGYEFDEFSQAYLVFTSNNFEVDIASPLGGAVESDRYNPGKPYNKAMLENAKYAELPNNTLRTADVDPDKYDAVYVVGGKGAMFDLPYDPSLQDIILNLYKREQTVIAAVCHGPAVFANVKNGEEFIINEVRLTGFTNEEEELFGKKWVKEFPFKLEDHLKARGAIFEQADFMLAHTTVSGKFVTGQNPFSTPASAEAVVKALGMEPVDRTPYPDENAMYLVEDILNDTITLDEAKGRLDANTDAFDIELMAVYGYYRILAAGENKEAIAKGIDLIRLTTPYYFNENLQLFLAKTYVSLEKQDMAMPILEELIKKDLLKEQAEEVLQQVKS
ncbi:type 1 glutamine amidotransferase domain-containing protein [Robertkochia sediminum]|uniref:type 1 glutamine amidotransferase domain-containing protein n=1 Tax=Robertkochia sediminum TaxID=2785326 RepID=UPI0019349A73|nr:type 1 glutamine amidotransferase domain-containing protein [Robertkochia sediminum]MBL7473247.1 type 1 glutamine amidotransferase domain-containing protein [Robertkochia sediminum]